MRRHKTDDRNAHAFDIKKLIGQHKIAAVFCIFDIRTQHSSVKIAYVARKEFFFKIEFVISQNPHVVIHIVERLNHRVRFKIVKKLRTVVLHGISHVD